MRFISEMVGFKWDMIYQKDGGMGYDLSVRWWALSGIWFIRKMVVWDTIYQWDGGL